MLVNSLGDVTITNDGAMMLKEMDVQHPAGKMIIEIAKSVDNAVGDGTTSSVVLSGALLESAGELIERGVRDMLNKDFIEPVSVKEQIIKSATECTCMILRIGDVIAGGRQGPLPPRGGPSGMGGMD